MAEAKENKAVAVDPHKPIKVLLKTVSPQITCSLCKGYLIDATTIVECLHSFCHSCIIKQLKTTEYCPICELMINKKKPNIKRDATLQAIVYKLVPGLYEKELLRKRAFYKSRPREAELASPEERGEDTEHLILSPTENIPLSLEYADVEEIEDQIELKQPKYLQCPAVFPVSHLKKYVLHKYGIDSNKFCVEIMYKVKTIVLPDHYTLMDVAYIYTWKKDASMKFFYRVRNKEPSPEELPEVPLRRSPSISDQKTVQTETNQLIPTESIKVETESIAPQTNVAPPITETSGCFIKPKSPKAIAPPSVCESTSETVKCDVVKRSAESPKPMNSVNNEKSDKLEKIEAKRSSEQRKSVEKVEKKSVKEEEKNQKGKSVKKGKSEPSEKRHEKIKLKIDLGQNSVTIFKSFANDSKTKSKTDSDNKNESSEVCSPKPKVEANGKKKQEIDVITLSKVTEPSDSNDNAVKYEIKSPKNNTCDIKELAIKSEIEIKIEPDVDEKKSEFLDSLELTPTKSLSPEKLAIIAERNKVENGNETVSKKEILVKNASKHWHQPCDQPPKVKSKSSNGIGAHKAKSSSNTTLPKQAPVKATTSHSSELSSTNFVTLHCKPNKDNPLKTTITKSSSLSPKMPDEKSIDEKKSKASPPQNQGKANSPKPEPTVSKRKSKEPIKNVNKRRYSLSLDSFTNRKIPLVPIIKLIPEIPKNAKVPVEAPTSQTKLPLQQLKEAIKTAMPSMPSLTDDKESSIIKTESKQTNLPNRIRCVDPCALGGKGEDKKPIVPENKANDIKATNNQKNETQNSLGKMLPPISTSTPRKATDGDGKGKMKLNRNKSLPPTTRKLPPILPKPSTSSSASSIPQITKMLKNPDTEIKQIPNGKDIKVYGPAMDMQTIPLGSSSPAYVPQYNTMHRNHSAGYLNMALLNSHNRSNDLPLGMRSPAYSPASPIYSPNSPSYNPNYNIPAQPHFKYMKSPAYVPNFPPMSNSAPTNSLKTPSFSPHKSEKVNESKKRANTNTIDGNSPPEKQSKVQSLLESCKINFPPSLSITLHEQNDQSLSNPLFNQMRNSPVNNFIEIVKLPEKPVKEDGKPVTQSKSETIKSSNVKPVTPKPLVPRSLSPKSNVSNVNDKEKVLQDNGHKTAPTSESKKTPMSESKKTITSESKNATTSESKNTTTNESKNTTTSESKKSPVKKSIPDIRELDKNISALLKVRREKDSSYQGKFLESILDKKLSEMGPSPPKMRKVSPERMQNGSASIKKSATPPLAPKVPKTAVKSLCKSSDNIKSSKPISPKSSSPRSNKSDTALDLSAHVSLANKSSTNNNNNNNKGQFDQPDVTALLAGAMARVHNPNFILPAFQQHMQNTLFWNQLSTMGRAGQNVLESFVKNLHNKNTENS